MSAPRGVNYAEYVADGGNPNCCSVCRWWDTGGSVAEEGRCRRHAPVALPSDLVEGVSWLYERMKGENPDPKNAGGRCQYTYEDVMHAAWPLTWDIHWCGDFEKEGG